MKHLAWDLGILPESGFKYGKTVATECSKRVKVDQIDNTRPTCIDCQQSRQSFEQAAQAALVARQ